MSKMMNRMKKKKTKKKKSTLVKIIIFRFIQSFSDF